MNEEKIIGTEISADEFLEEYNNQLEEKGNVEIIDLENNETKVLSEKEFEEYIKVKD